MKNKNHMQIIACLWYIIIMLGLNIGAGAQDSQIQSDQEQTLNATVRWLNEEPQNLVQAEKKKSGDKTIFWLKNDRIKCALVFAENKLVSEIIEPIEVCSQQYNAAPDKIITDGDFALEVQLTDEQAPEKNHNADNPVMLTKENILLEHVDVQDYTNEDKEMVFTFKGIDGHLQLELTYLLSPNAFFVKRQLSVYEFKLGNGKMRNYFLQRLWPRYGFISGEMTIIKAGGLGEPLAVQFSKGGAFFGLEYPASINTLESAGNRGTAIRTGQEVGANISSVKIRSEWSVAGLTPDPHIKLWFNRYLNTVRVARLRPYLLYNTWYDVRAPEYTDRPENVMNEQNLLRIISNFKREMVEKREIMLDAFVLDDGWDTYKSDWVLREKEFPNGLKPIQDALKSMGTDLGIWIGPTGGYSHREWRVGWMKEHGYEVAGDQLCLAGSRYYGLFRKRVTDFAKQGVAYFKWDGIQFSCNEPDHGHPVGIFSRQAVMKAVEHLNNVVRNINPRMFLNITSGTWLSPWWLRYANTIWMQGEDYGWASIPSISKRDAAITYRDVVLYEDYKTNDSWFPISNLMTHGIIKGHLQKLGDEKESLKNFTDETILYFARGVTMWELYISPDLLTDDEWDAIAKSIRWARNRFDTLINTAMIGGDPNKHEPYGYVHYTGNRGIIAVRNPFIEPKTMKLQLDPAHGLNPDTPPLILERVYPNRWVSTQTYKADDTIEINLQGYETAIYELYTLDTAKEPIVSGATFEVVIASGKDYLINLRNIEPGAKLLNPELITQIKVNGEMAQADQLNLVSQPPKKLLEKTSMQRNGNDFIVTFSMKEKPESATLALLIEPEKEKQFVRNISVALDDKIINPEIEQQEGGNWAWYKINITPSAGAHTTHIRILTSFDQTAWAGTVSPWLFYTVAQKPIQIQFMLKEELTTLRPMPPLPLPSGEDMLIEPIKAIIK